MIAIGVITRKKIKPNMIGEKILFNVSPNLYQILFNGLRIFVFKNPDIKKKNAINREYKNKSFLLDKR